MDSLSLAGVFVAGMGVGLAVWGQKEAKADSRPCTCESHCAAPPSSREDSGFSPIVFVSTLLTIRNLVLVCICLF